MQLRLILYGLGQGLELIEKSIKSKHIIIGYMDSYARIKQYGGVFWSLESIKELEFDYIIITVIDRSVAWDIRNLLVNKYKISHDKIIPFYVYAKRELWDVKIRNCNAENIKGLIFGNSNAAYGFLEKELTIPFLNLSVPSQDLYYEYNVFLKCLKKYGRKLKNLEYIVIDLYDYIEFNIDCSLSKNILNYLYCGGIYEEHNYFKNLNYSKSLNEELFEKHKILKKNNFDDVMDDLFIDWSLKNILDVDNRWNHIEYNEPLSGALLTAGIVENIFDDTIKENKKILYNFLKTIRTWSPEIKIIFTLIPRYITMEKATEKILEPWKHDFFRTINMFCEFFKISFFNYKHRTEISMNHMFYWDIEHMNTIGGRALSAILNEDIKGLKVLN